MRGSANILAAEIPGLREATISTPRGVSCIENRETIYRGIAPPENPIPELPADTPWRESIELTPMLLYRFAT